MTVSPLARQDDVAEGVGEMQFSYSDSPYSGECFRNAGMDWLIWPWRCCHLDAPRCISFAIVHTKYNEARLHDGTAHGQAHSGVDGVQRARGAVRRAWGLLRDRPPDLAGICSDGAVGHLMSFVEISTETRFR